MTESRSSMNRFTTLQLLCAALVWTHAVENVASFQAPAQFGARPSGRVIINDEGSRHVDSSLHAARGMGGMGGGMTKAPPKKKSKKGLSGKVSAKAAPFNVNASLSRLEKRYDEISLAAAKTLQQDEDSPGDMATTEYMVTARAVGKSQKSSVPDWVPIAQMTLARSLAKAQDSEGAFDPAARAAVSLYCRELSLAASVGAPVFQSVARNEMQYAVESMDSFSKHVYDVVVEGKNEDASNENTMTKVEARSALNLEDENVDKSGIKVAYRKLSFALHPDRFVGTNKSESELQESSNEFLRVKLAYETLSSGVRDEGKSWYESLGGRARTDFAGPIDLLSLAQAQSTLESNGIQSAVTGVNPDLMSRFLVRNKRS